MEEELKTVTASGSFLTQWYYNSADFVSEIRYPSNASGQVSETITYDYHPQGALNSLRNGSNDYYVQGTTYEAAGQVDVRTLNDGSMSTNYNYYPWDQ